MITRLRTTFDALALRHLVAVLFALCLTGLGWFLTWHLTDCWNLMGELTNETMFCRKSWLSDLRHYGFRPYGVALIVASLAFIVLVLRDALRNAVQDRSQ